MDAAASPTISPARGAPRLLEDCAALGRAVGSGQSARARLESELGAELVRLLFSALLSGRGPRAGFRAS